MTKSEIFKKAHAEARKNPFGNTTYRVAFRTALIRAYADARNGNGMSIEEAKEQFWGAWKNLKANQYSRIPSMRTMAINRFDDACDALAQFSLDALRAAFGTYFDFVASKARIAA